MDAESLLPGLVGPGVVAREIRSGEADGSLLWPEEAALVADVSRSRWRDFTLGRRCARLAMVDLGLEPRPVLRGERRQPVWPAGVVGSITHTAGYAAAVLGRADDVVSVGVDAERHEPLPEGVARRIARPEEAAHLAALGPRAPELHADRLLFCIKEAVYKVWFPVAQRWLGYLDASATIDAEAGTFEVAILEAGPIDRLAGRFAHGGGIVVATIEHRRGPSADGQ